MDFDLSDDQVALQEAAAALLKGLSSPARVRAAEGFDRELWSALVEQGWLGIDVPEAAGGVGLGFVEVAVLLEQSGRHTSPVPFLETTLALGALLASGSNDGHEWAGRLLSGASVGCVVRAGWPVIYAPEADVAVVTTDDALYLLDLTASDRPHREPAMDLTRSIGWVTADPAAGSRIGDREAAEELLNRAAVAYSAQMLGSAEAVLEMSVQYAKERVQFGKPIGSFQAVKHRCADMLVDVEAMRSAVYYAAWCVATGAPDRSIAASTAKIWCSDAAQRVMSSGLQVHGGLGFTWEHDLHLYLKRSQLDQVSWGDAAHHRERLAGMLRSRVAAGRSVI